MVRVEGIAEEDDYSVTSSDIEDMMNEPVDEDDEEIEDEKPLLWELDSNGKPIYDEDRLIESFNTQCNTIQEDIDYIDEFLESGPHEPNYLKFIMMDRLATMQSAQTIAEMIVGVLLKEGLHASNMETIHQMYNHATSKVSAMKAEINELF